MFDFLDGILGVQGTEVVGMAFSLDMSFCGGGGDGGACIVEDLNCLYKNDGNLNQLVLLIWEYVV